MKTFHFIKRLSEHVSFGKLAQLQGVTVQTAEAWGREPESNANPFGTGRKNPLDHALRIVALAHKEDAALAHEMAEIFPEYVRYLDGRVNKSTRGRRPLNEMIGHCVKEHSEAVVELLNGDNPDFAKAYTEIKEAIIALEKLGVWVKEAMHSEPLKVVERV